MTNTTTIEIDFEIYKLIEAERRSFDEPRLAALRRLLGLGNTLPLKEPKSAGRAWTDEGVTLPHGTLLKMTYNRQAHEGEIVDGKWLVEGKIYESPSGAMIGVARTKKGEPTHLNGWNYWFAKLPASDRWVALKTLQNDSNPNRIRSGHELLQSLGLGTHD